MAVIKPVSEKSPAGRKPDPATSAKLKLIAKDIGAGVPYCIAALSNGLSERFLYECIKQGELDIEHGDDTYHAKFAQDLRTIEKNAIASCVADIRPSEKGHKGAEWILERRYWKHFSSNVPAVEIQKQLDEVQKLLSEQDKLKGV